MFGDAYVEGIGLAGGDINTTLTCFSLVLERVVNEQMFLLEKLSHVELQALHYLTQIFRNGKDLSRKVSLFTWIYFDLTISTVCFSPKKCFSDGSFYQKI